MIAGRRVLAVVPARGGSKGIALKNLRKVGGVSLVARAARVAAELDEIDRAVVSTDHDGIAEAAENAGLSAPFRRPEALSGDRIADWDVLHHALTEMEARDGVTYDIVLMLQPTSPGRRADDLRRTLQMLVEGGFDAVWTLSETDSKGHPLKQLQRDEDGRFEYYDPAGAAIVARQQLTPVYHRNGVAYAITRACLETQRSIKGVNPGAVVIDRPLANIDTELDLDWADFLAQRGAL
jgi:CMP-N-acetylneuraminic acid synthetase